VHQPTNQQAIPGGYYELLLSSATPLPLSHMVVQLSASWFGLAATDTLDLGVVVGVVVVVVGVVVVVNGRNEKIKNINSLGINSNTDDGQCSTTRIAIMVYTTCCTQCGDWWCWFGCQHRSAESMSTIERVTAVRCCSRSLA
jgi:hypothetical protein